jgi:tetratricopeptide (TPR) repeat protein
MKDQMLPNLSNAEIATMKFHEGYGYFAMKQFSDAKPLFEAIAQIPSDSNYYDANYYYGYISFAEKNYAQALSSFKIIEKQPAYLPIIHIISPRSIITVAKKMKH